MRAASSRRTRIMRLALLGSAPCLIFLGLTIKNAYDARLGQAEQQNLGAARVLALLLDEKCTASADMLRTEANRYGLNARNRAGLKQIVSDNSNLVGAAICDREGRLAAAAPAELSARTQASRARLLSEIRALHARRAFDLFRLANKDRTELLGTVIPLGGSSPPTSYLIAYSRTPGVQTWLHRAGPEGRLQIAVRRPDGRVVDIAGAGGTPPPLPKAPAKPGAADRKLEGFLLARAPGAKEDSVVGFARAQVPGWNVQVSQPLGAAQAANAVLFPLLLLFVVGCSIVLFVAARNFARLYERLETMQLALVEQNLHLRDLEKTKSNFLDNVSHDLWTPMASLEISLTGLLDPRIQWRPEQVRERLELAHRELNQLINRVRNLLQMARLDANVELAQKEPCDLVDIVGSALERLSPLLAGRPLETDFPPIPLMLDCAHEEIESVVINLLDNALKYSPAGSPLVLKGERRGSDVFLSLRDWGSGIEVKDRERIFEKFYRAQKAHFMGGAGMGLAICKAVVERHGGVIGLVDPPDGGAEFWFTIPGMPLEANVVETNETEQNSTESNAMERDAMKSNDMESNNTEPDAAEINR